MDDICLTRVLHFCKFLAKPSIDLELDSIFGKAMKCRFQRHIVHTEILPIFHVRVEYIYVSKYAIQLIQTNGEKQLLLLGYMDPSNTIIMIIPPPIQSPPPMTARLVHALPHNYTTKSPLVTMGCPKFTPKTAFLFDDHHHNQ